MLRPQFKIFRTVIIADTIFMMHILVCKKIAAKYFSHNKAVFENVWFLRSWPESLSSFRVPKPDIAALEHSSAFPSIAMLFAPEKKTRVFSKGCLDTTRARTMHGGLPIFPLEGRLNKRFATKRASRHISHRARRRFLPEVIPPLSSFIFPKSFTRYLHDKVNTPEALADTVKVFPSVAVTSAGVLSSSA